MCKYYLLLAISLFDSFDIFRLMMVLYFVQRSDSGYDDIQLGLQEKRSYLFEPKVVKARSSFFLSESAEHEEYNLSNQLFSLRRKKRKKKRRDGRYRPSVTTPCYIVPKEEQTPKPPHHMQIVITEKFPSLPQTTPTCVIVFKEEITTKKMLNLFPESVGKRKFHMNKKTYGVELSDQEMKNLAKIATQTSRLSRKKGKKRYYLRGEDVNYLFKILSRKRKARRKRWLYPNFQPGEPFSLIPKQKRKTRFLNCGQQNSQ